MATYRYGKGFTVNQITIKGFLLFLNERQRKTRQGNHFFFFSFFFKFLISFKFFVIVSKVTKFSRPYKYAIYYGCKMPIIKKKKKTIFFSPEPHKIWSQRHTWGKFHTENGFTMQSRSSLSNVLVSNGYMQTQLFNKLMYMQTYFVHIIINYVNNNINGIIKINKTSFILGIINAAGLL